MKNCVDLKNSVEQQKWKVIFFVLFLQKDDSEFMANMLV